MNLLIVATVHGLMNDIRVIDSCPCNTFRTSNSFARSDTGVVIDIESHLFRTCKTSFLFAPSHWLFLCSVLHSNRIVNTTHCFVSKIINNFRYLYTSNEFILQET